MSADSTTRSTSLSRWPSVPRLTTARRNHLLVFLQLASNAAVGYVFARLLAYMFGISAEKDGFDIAYSVPFIILTLSGFVFGHAVVTAHFARLRAANPEKLQVVFSTALNLMLVLGAGLVAVCFVIDEPLIKLLAPGLPAETQDHARHWMLLMLPLTMTLGLSTFMSAVLVAYEIPLTAESCQLVSRLGVIVWLFVAGAVCGLDEIAVALVCASVVGLAITAFVLHRQTGLRFTLEFSPLDEHVRGMIWQGGSFMIAALAAQASTAYMRRLATIDAIGTNAMLTYCFGLVAPLSILVGKPLALVMGPTYVALAAQGRYHDARRLLVQNLTISIGVGVTAAALVSMFATSFIRLLYQGGSFDESAVHTTAQMCVVCAWMLPPAIVLWVVLVPTINGKQRFLPAAIYLSGYLVQIAATASLFPVYGKNGLVIAYLLGVYLQALLSTAVAVRECFAAGLPSVLRDQVCHEPTC